MKSRSRKLTLAAALLAAVGLALGAHLWASYHYRQAERALARQDYDAARRHLTHCARVWWRDPQTHLLLARTARLAREYDRAEALLRDCRELDVPGETVDLEYKLILAQQGYLASVEGYLVGRVLQGDPDSAHILEVLTRAYLANYQLEPARECVRRWLEVEPDRTDAWLLRAQIFERLRNSTECLASYRRLVELDPENCAAHLTLAGLLLEGHDPQEALAHFEYVRQRQGDSAALLTGMARCRRILNQPDEARRLLEAVLAGQPGNWAALSERGRLALETESPEEAEKWFRQAVAVKPYEKDATYGLYQSLVRLGKGAEAGQVLARFNRIEADLNRMAGLAQAIAHDGHNPELRCEAGTILLRNGLEAEGVEWLESALREDPGHVPSHRALAEYYERTGALDRAARHRAFAPAAADPPVASTPAKGTP